MLFFLLTAHICHPASISFSPPAWIHQFKSYLTISLCSFSLNAYILQASALPFFFSFPSLKLFPLPCTHISFSLSIFNPIFLFALEFKDGISGTRRGYIIFCRPLLRLPASLCFLLLNTSHCLVSPVPCHVTLMAVQDTVLSFLMTWSQTQQSSLTKTHKLDRQFT